MSAQDDRGGARITSTIHSDPSGPDNSTSLGVSAGDGMIHYVLLTQDEVGRSVVDSRVIDVDRSDGLGPAGRVNAGIDLMLSAAREAGLRVGPIGVTARTVKQRRELRSRGTGPRRQIHLFSDDEAVVAYLSATGHISRFASVVVADCGDSGMSLYTVDTASGRITATKRTGVLAGREIDRSIVAALMSDETRTVGSWSARRSLLSACRTAKEEVAPNGDNHSVMLAEGGNHVVLTTETVETALRPIIAQARAEVANYLSASAARGVKPAAVVLVGGIANLPAVRSIADDTDAEVIIPESPELAASMGAAILTRAKATPEGGARLAFIGGKRPRQWLSATPVAMAAALLAAAMMTIYAISSSLGGHNEPARSASPHGASQVTSSDSVSTVHTQTTTTRTPEPTTTRRPNPKPPPKTYEPPVQQSPVETHWNDQPGWATTELPPTPPSSEQPTQEPSQSTRTLVPYPLPSLPWTPGAPPTIPPGLLPPDMDPHSTSPHPSTPPPPNLQSSSRPPNQPAPSTPGRRPPPPPPGSSSPSVTPPVPTR